MSSTLEGGYPPNDVVSALAERIVEDRGVGAPEAMAMASEYIDVRNAVVEGNMEASASSPSQGHLAYPGQEKFWIDTMLFFKGLPTVIRSRMGQGKTHLLSWAVLRAAVMHPDWDILTNIPWYWIGDQDLVEAAMSDFAPITSMSEMLRLCARSVLDGRVPLVAIDEMDHAITSHRWRSDENVSWQHFTYLERHLEIRGPLLIYHSWNDVPYYMRKGGVVNQHLWVSIHGGQRYVFNTNTRPYYLHVSGAFIPYSSHGAMGFKIDVDMGKLHSLLKVTRRMDMAQQVLDNLNECMVQDEKEYEDEDDRLQRAYDRRDAEIRRRLMNGDNTRDICTDLKVSPNVVSRIKMLMDFGEDE